MRKNFWNMFLVAIGLVCQSGLAYALTTGYCYDSNPLTPGLDEPRVPYEPGDINWTMVQPNGLSTGLVTITSAAVATTGTNVLPGALPATNCAGIFVGNDQPAGITGYHGDGLLNGEAQQGNNDDPLLDPNVVFNPGAFVTTADLQDLDQDGEIDDAGWVSLFKTEADDGDEYQSPAGLDLTDFMTISTTCNGGVFNGCSAGEWSITYQDPQGLLDALSQTEFGDSFFDHLAISFKQANKFIIFDFDFNLINEVLNGAIDLSLPYDLEGTFDVAPVGWNGLSHISFSARDPIDSTEVPSPEPLALIALGLLLVATYHGRRRKV